MSRVNRSRCTNVGVSTTINGYLTTICPDSDVVVVATNAIDCTFTFIFNGEVTASRDVEHAIARLVVCSRLDGLTIEVNRHLLSHFDSSISCDISHHSDGRASFSSFNSGREGDVTHITNHCHIGTFLNGVVVAISNCDITISAPVGVSAFGCAVSRVEAIELTTRDSNRARRGVMAVERPSRSLANERTTVDNNFTTILDVNQVEVCTVRTIILSAFVGVSTTIDGHLTAVSPDSDVVDVATNAINRTFTIEGEVTAILNPEDTIAFRVSFSCLDGLAIEVNRHLLSHFNCSISSDISHHGNGCTIRSGFNSSLKGCVTNLTNLSDHFGGSSVNIFRNRCFTIFIASSNRHIHRGGAISEDKVADNFERHFSRRARFNRNRSDRFAFSILPNCIRNSRKRHGDLGECELDCAFFSHILEASRSASQSSSDSFCVSAGDNRHTHFIPSGERHGSRVDFSINNPNFASHRKCASRNIKICTILKLQLATNGTRTCDLTIGINVAAPSTRQVHGARCINFHRTFRRGRVARERQRLFRSASSTCDNNLRQAFCGCSMHHRTRVLRVCGLEDLHRASAITPVNAERLRTRKRTKGVLTPYFSENHAVASFHLKRKCRGKNLIVIRQAYPTASVDNSNLTRTRDLRIVSIVFVQLHLSSIIRNNQRAINGHRRAATHRSCQNSAFSDNRTTGVGVCAREGDAIIRLSNLYL